MRIFREKVRLALLGLALIAIFLFLATLSCTNIKALASFPLCQPISENSIIAGSGAIHLGLLSIALFFLYEKDLASMLKGIGFPGSLKTTAIYTVIGLIAMFVLLFLLGILSLVFGFNDQYKISDKIAGLPWYVLLLAVVIAPFTEELFFRAFLIPWLGKFAGKFAIILSSILFSISHVTYGSVVEILGVFVVGLVLGTVFVRSKSITPCIAIHLIYNLFSISVMLLLKSAI
jgi:membrane protease YdiL (CAAX protease family)